MKSSKPKEALRRRADVLTLFLLLAVGLTLIVYSIAAQDEDVQRDMEEYSALAERVQTTEKPQNDFASEADPQIVPSAADNPPEQAQTTAVPASLAEILEAAAEIIQQPDSSSVAETISQEPMEETWIIEIPTSHIHAVPPTEKNTDPEKKPTSASVPKETNPPETTNQPDEAAVTAEPDATLPETPSTPVPRIGKTGVDLQACKASNGDFVAWLTIPGTKINYPVVWTDRVDYYLTHTFSGKESKIGTLFSLRKTDYVTPSRNIAVYGHHITTSGGNMFQPLTSYKKQSFYENHKTIYFDTLYDLGEYTVFAVVNMKSTDWDASAASFDSDQAFLVFVNRAKAASLYDTGVEVTADDFILTLITCDRDYHDPDGRLIVMAVKQ